MPATDGSQPPHISPFFHHSSKSSADVFAILHVRRDSQIPVLLRQWEDDEEGYDEGKVANTRFGSFPYSTLIDVPFGTQVRASKVDTGSRGRRPGGPRKRKREAEVKDTPETSSPGDAATSSGPAPLKKAVAAASGFGHLLPPTPERYTACITHRTQLVYVPDYAYILQRLQARPGSVIIEAGGGSGSFTHAAARAVFNGYPSTACEGSEPGAPDGMGRVWTFELDATRATELQADIREHGLAHVVRVTQRDVYSDGFGVPTSASPSPLPSPSNGSTASGRSINANIVFLDLPAPWRALPHLARTAAHSPLDPCQSTQLCVFSPCIEQVQRTVVALRSSGWVDVHMMELAARRLDIRRERVGLCEEGLRGVNATAATVDEAVARLREVEQRTRIAHAEEDDRNLQTRQQRLQDNVAALDGRKLYAEGRLISRAEPDLNTHTSYLVFATLPMAWSAEDEAAARARDAEWEHVPPPEPRKSKNQVRREKHAARVAMEARQAANAESNA